MPQEQHANWSNLTGLVPHIPDSRYLYRILPITSDTTRVLRAQKMALQISIVACRQQANFGARDDQQQPLPSFERGARQTSCSSRPSSRSCPSSQSITRKIPQRRPLSIKRHQVRRCFAPLMDHGKPHSTNNVAMEANLFSLPSSNCCLLRGTETRKKRPPPPAACCWLAGWPFAMANFTAAPSQPLETVVLLFLISGDTSLILPGCCFPNQLCDLGDRTRAKCSTAESRSIRNLDD